MSEPIFKAAPGRPEYKKHLLGERLTRGQAIKAACYECMGFYVDGVISCQIPECSLYLNNPVARRLSTSPTINKQHRGKGKPLDESDRTLISSEERLKEVGN
jgi:hypothetical protein